MPKTTSIGLENLTAFQFRIRVKEKITEQDSFATKQAPEYLIKELNGGCGMDACCGNYVITSDRRLTLPDQCIRSSLGAGSKFLLAKIDAMVVDEVRPGFSEKKAVEGGDNKTRGELAY
jgi:hypothetical protein